ncbi:MAG: tetratricopeptide repeat protein [Alphaproteobacteria bacterium]
MSVNKEKEIVKKKLDYLINLYEQKNFSNLVIEAEKFINDYKNSTTAWNLLAVGYKGAGNINKAMTTYESLLNKNPNVESFNLNLANIYSDLGRINESISLYKRAISLNPNSINSYNGLGIAFHIQKRFDEAIDAYKKILKLDSKNENANFNLAETYRTIEKYDEAIDFYENSNHRLSKSHQLECVYRVRSKAEFIKKLERVNLSGNLDPLMACLNTHSSIRYKYKDQNPFCLNSLDFIKKYDLKKEDGFDNDLIKKIVFFHKNSQSDYMSQSLLSNGTQSAGNLFLLKDDFIQILKDIIMRKIATYRNDFKGINNGFLKNWPERNQLHGWIVSMKSGGKLDSHIHKQGWLSGSLYISLPKENNSDSGNISFSYNGGGYPTDGVIFKEKIIDIDEGQIVLFPSSIFHKTIPFYSTKERVSLAFDIKPTL